MVRLEEQHNNGWKFIKTNGTVATSFSVNRYIKLRKMIEELKSPE